mgnify:CR=1 FL=1
MPVRLVICPIIGTGTEDDPYRAKVADYGGHHACAIPTGPLGAPMKSWCLAAINAADLTAVDANPDIRDVVEGFADGFNGSRAALRTFLSTHTVGDVPALKRAAINARLTALGVDTTGLTLASTLWDVIQRIKDVLEPGDLALLGAG